MEKRKLTGVTQAHVIVAGSAFEAGVESYSRFERLIDNSLYAWSLPLGSIVVPDSLDETTRDMAERYAHDRIRRVKTVRGPWKDYGQAAAPIRDRKLVASASHAIIFAAQATRDTERIYHRVVRESMPFVKVDL